MGSQVSHLSNKGAFVVLFNYAATGLNEVDCRVGDEVQILDSENEDWCKILHFNSNKIGLVPRSYLAKAGSLASKR